MPLNDVLKEFVFELEIKKYSKSLADKVKWQREPKTIINTFNDKEKEINVFKGLYDFL